MSRAKSSNKKSSTRSEDVDIWVAPKRDLAIRVGHTFRFQNTAGTTNVQVQVKDLLGLVAAATAATTLTSCLCAIKLSRVTVRTPAAAAAFAAPTIQWNGLNYESPQYLNEVSLGTAEPAVLVSKPPRGSDPSFWLSQATGASTVVFIISAPVNSITDVECTVIFQNASTLGNIAPLTYTGSSGLTAGYVYFGNLDRSASSQFTPVQVNRYA